MQKRLFLHTVLALSASAGLATAQTQAHAATPLKFQLDWRFEGPAAFFLQPVAKGYFKDAGLDVTVDAGSGSGGVVQRVASGAYDLGFADIAALMEFQANNPDMVKNLGTFEFPGPDGTKTASLGSGYTFVASNQGGDAKVEPRKEFLKRLYTPERAAERALSRPMFAFPSMYSALKIYRKDPSVADFQEEIDSITNAFENSHWYWYGMEHGLSQLSSAIESTTFFGEAIQGVALGTRTSADAVDYIDQQLQEQIANLGK